MKRINRIVIWLTTTSLFFPVVTNASECVDVINKIVQDTSNPNTTWYNTTTIPQLIDTLGQAEKSNLANGKIKYGWVCPDNETSLYVFTKDGSRITNISGKYHMSSGWGVFMAIDPEEIKEQ